MNYKLKRVVAVLVILLIAFGWYVTLFGLGSVMDPTINKIKLGLDIKGGVYVVMEAQDTEKMSDEELKEVMTQTQAVIEKRVNEMGLAEPTVTIEGSDRIRVELPGADDAEEAINQIGKTAQLQFALADGSVVLDGSNVKTATTGTAEDGGYAVNLEFDSTGAKKFEEATAKAYGQTVTPAIDGIQANEIMILLDNQIISHPGVKDGPIPGGKCEITGGFTQDQAKELAALIRGGALPTELKEVTSSVQTAKIGFNALEQSVLAGLIGLALIFIIMLVGYRLMGLTADIALLLYVVIILNAMALMGSVLTLPGIAGIILSVGMAVDANVVIFSRIREEIIGGKTIRVAVQSGFKRAMSTVIDSQVTTFIAAIILYQVGTSSVKGFAWTLMIGILASLVTAVLITQLYLSILSESKRFTRKGFFGIKKDNTATFQIKRDIHFIRHRKIFYIITVAIMLIGLGFGLVRGGLNYGIDFTGGTMIQVDMGKQVPVSDVEKSLKKHKLDPEIIYSGEGNEEVVIRTMEALDADQRAEVINTLKGDFGFEDSDVVAQELFGPSVGKELRNNAIKAILLSALFMLIYIRLRFSEWKFGGAALLGVLNDVLILIAFYAIFNVQVNNPFIAGILTVVGYSINDTIVVFDRIRENMKYSRRGGTEELIDKSITQTLGRSLMTSFTTLVVMIPLFVMTGSAIREFTLPLMVGVLAGACSSITICSPLYYEFSTRGRGSKYLRDVKKKKAQRKKDKNEK
ncbi:protein translocase subunit SecD [Anaerovorax odorimutans]|uniref:Multifunctional fusion protein n=1 Tax=Anaerovorax odorimutans TaxID=109327 RepID=A0ABT1RL49_9FIRM|nr:protein translocase subunit SecD [Anaerovorax odorimutans]MCQ4635915.1 protein translocase subunit SecD [Anaerovorax odorimutans]